MNGRNQWLKGMELLVKVPNSAGESTIISRRFLGLLVASNREKK